MNCWLKKNYVNKKPSTKIILENTGFFNQRCFKLPSRIFTAEIIIF